MSKTLAPVPYQTFFDEDGYPLSNGTIYTYQAGTLDLAETYSDSDGTPHPNPIELDPAGRAVIYLSPGSAYKFYVFDTDGGPQPVQDNILAVPESTAPEITATEPDTITTTGDQVALLIPESTGAIVIIANNATLLTIKGITAGFDGQQLLLMSKGAGQVNVINQSVDATAANRIMSGMTGIRSLAAGTGFARFLYDGAEDRWRVVEHEQGAWISPTFAAGDYTGTASMTWTVQAPDVSRCAYMLRGKTLTVSMALNATSVGGTPASYLTRVVPGGYVATSVDSGPTAALDNGTPVPGSGWVVGSAVIAFTKDFTLANWAASANGTSLWAVMEFEVN